MHSMQTGVLCSSTTRNPKSFSHASRRAISSTQSVFLQTPASPDPYFGSGVHILLKRVQQHVWTITLRDDFGTPFITYVGGGMELANMWVRFALKRQGNKVTGYYSFNDSPAAWIPVGCWEASKNGSSFGISTWTAGAEFDYLIARPLQSHTS